ncbi:MAG: hypothetical protein U9R07_07560 [Pseudomonadota bacterium]|nr:hypothetical protein [Pseudomonadota bacterium]
MKSRRLTETDIVNLAFKPVATKRLRLTSLERPKKIVGSYEPFRAHNGDAVNQQFPLLAREEPETPLATLEQVIARACKGDPELLAMNLPIARATHDYAVEHGIRAIREDVRKLVLPFGHAYEFGMPLLMVYPTGRIAAVFPDLRRSEPLTAIGRRAAFSMMHHRWRENYPDLAQIDLEIWRYANNDLRSIQAIKCNEEDLFPYDQMIADARQTYQIWHEVVANASDERKRGGTDWGPLFAKR